MENYTNETPVVDETPVVEQVEAVVEAPAEKNKLFSILSLVGGLVSLLLTCCYGSSIPFGIASIVFFVIDKKKNNKASGLSVIGMICGILGMVGGLIVVILAAIGSSVASMGY